MSEPGHTLELARNTLRDIARRIERLTPRQQRQLFRRTGLDAGIVRNESERCNDILVLYGHVDQHAPFEGDPEELERYLDRFDLT